LVCSSDEDSSPYVARGLPQNLTQMREDQMSTQQFITNQLRKGKSDGTACPGVNGFTDYDWASLDELVAAARRPAADEKTK
jgi:hypothetical protein